MGDDIGQWLDELGLGQYAQAFAENTIGFDVLHLLSDDDLKELGLSLGDRRRLQAAIESLGSETLTKVTASPFGGKEDDASQRTDAGAERRQLTVMFCDLVDSTKLSRRLDPEDLREVIRTYQNNVAGEIARYEGHVAKFMGDGVIAYFGYPRAHEDDAERAIRSALSIIKVIPKLHIEKAKPLEIRIGIATGQVVVGDIIGEGAAREEAVTGDTPNLAARLQAFAKPNSIVVSEATRELTGKIFDWENLGLKKLKGITEQIQIWQVEGERSIESRFEGRSGKLTAFVGREHEVGLLLERWQRAMEGEGQVILLSGEAGIGKSRILEVLRAHLSTETHLSLHYQCSPYHTNSAFYPIIGHLERAAGFTIDDGIDQKIDKLEQLFAPNSEQPDLMPLMSALLSLPLSDKYPQLDLTPQQQKTRTLEALSLLLSSHARKQPVLILFEDAHWADPTTLEFLEMLTERLVNQPILVIITHRPEFEVPWQRYGHVTPLVLNRLSRIQCAAIVLDMTNGKPLPSEVLDQIVEKTDGVPLFLEELTKTVIESGFLRETEDQFELVGPLPPLAIPSTLQDSLMARLDRLAPVKEVAQIGSAIGREFPYRLLAAVARLSDNELQDNLGKLVESELVFRRGSDKDTIYVFKHALVQDVAYESLLKSRRQELHLLIARALEESFSDIVESEPELLAYHYTAAGLEDEAVTYWQKAGERALMRSANVEAINHLSKGLEKLKYLAKCDERDRRELEMQLALGPALMAVRGQGAKEARHAYARARELAEKTGETQQLSQAFWGSWRSYFMHSEHDNARRIGEEYLSLAEVSQDEAINLAARFALGGTFVFAGDFSSARVHIEQANSLYDIKKHRSLAFSYGQDPGASSLSYLSWTLWFLGYPDRAIESGLKALALADELKHPFTRAQVLMYLTITHALRLDWSVARSRAEETMTLSKEHGFPQTYWLSSSIHARTMVQEGRLDVGVSQLKQSVTSRKAIGVAVARLLELALLAESYGAAHQNDEEMQALNEALEFADRTGEGFYLPEIHRLKGELLLRQDDPKPNEEATNCFQRALSVARHQQTKSLELRAATSLARLWRNQGMIAEARDLLSPAYNWFTEGFETLDLQDAKALLDELD